MPVAVFPRPQAATMHAPLAVEYLSWSRLRTLRDCPKQFYFRYVEKVSEERVSAALPFGGSIHRAIERVAETRLAGRPLPSVLALLNEFDAGWNEAAADGVPVVFSKGEDAKSLRQLAARMLAAYREFALTEKNEVIAVEHETRFQIAGIEIVARLDSVELRGTDLLLTDVKTSRSKWSESRSLENVLQTVLYAHAAVDMVKVLGAKRIVPRFVVITKAKKPVVQIIEPKVGQADVERLRELVTETTKIIASGAFPRCESWKCQHCPFASRCLGRTT